MSLAFEFETPVGFFEKADAPKGKTRRIGGLISTESRDRQLEVVIQKGLDLSDFIAAGWYNDNHSKDTDGIVGYPESIQQFEKGDRLPDGRTAHANGTWAEGYLLEGHDRADRLWKLGQALQKSTDGRRLGFSIEGSVEKRLGANKQIIAKAKVRNVAITNCPVNTDTRLDILAKSLGTIEQVENDALLRALSLGTPTPGAPPSGPQTGEGSGQILTPESLEGASVRKRRKKKLLSKSEAFAVLASRYPDASAASLGRIVDLTLLRQRRCTP